MMMIHYNCYYLGLPCFQLPTDKSVFKQIYPSNDTDTKRFYSSPTDVRLRCFSSFNQN
jgi:hypothetical protein